METTHDTRSRRGCQFGNNSPLVGETNWMETSRTLTIDMIGTVFTLPTRWGN
ncbi:hypothetical protein [Microcoleus sp. LAD1_D3]|uniref:hypothetical protein n=1 Tax=Microcoleus sp. LAD1_D3 TaxID=2819365 RepID=UPI004040B343